MVVAHANSLRGTYVSSVVYCSVLRFILSSLLLPFISLLHLTSCLSSDPLTRPFTLPPFILPSLPPSLPLTLPPHYASFFTFFFLNSGIVKHIDGLNTEQIQKIGIPNGIPLVYKFDKYMRPIVQPKAVAPLSGEYLEKKV
jgi:hypothetical protein